MNDVSRPAVRPGFLKASLVVFVLLIPFVLFTAWDYYESARQDRFLKRIDPDGRILKLPVIRLTAEEERAERLYRAAAVLAGTNFQTAPETMARLSRLTTAAHQNSWSADLLPDLRELDAAYVEALDFATRAAALPFRDFVTRTDYNYQFGSVYNLQQFLGYRAMLRALSGDDAGAIDALYVEARLARTTEGGYSYIFWQGDDLARVLERTHGAAQKLEPLARSVAEVDEAYDRNETAALLGMTRRVLGQRFLTVGIPSYWLYVLSRPITNHLANEQLDGLADAVPVSQMPWPERLDREIALRPFGIVPKPLTPSEYAERVAIDRTSRIATFRCVRVIVAVERFRRERGQFPPSVDALVPTYLTAPLIDPFSGKPLLLNHLSDGYVVYSVGADRRDDGGAIDESGTFPFGVVRKDVGIRMRDR